jgi:intergrase/recombinase
MFPIMGRSEQEVDLENPADRKKVIELIHQAREWEEKAVEHLEEALALME